MTLTLNKEDIKLEEWEFEFKQRNAHPPIMADWWLCGMRDHFASETRLPAWRPDYIITCEHKGYIKSAHKHAMLESLREAVKDRQYLHYVLEGTVRAMKENLDNVAQELMRDFSPDARPARLLEIWTTLERGMHKAIPWFWAPYYLSEENMITDRVKEGLERHRARIEAIADIDTALSLLITPTKEPSFVKEQREFGQLVAMAKADQGFAGSAEFMALVEEYLLKYSWMSTYFIVPLEPLSLAELIERIQTAAGKGAAQDTSQDAMQEKVALVERLQAAYKGDQQLEEAVEDARELGWVLTASVESALNATAKFIPLYKALAKALGVSYEHLGLLTSSDIVEGLTNGTRVNDIELEERKKGYVACLQNGEIAWMWGEPAREFAQALSERERPDQGLREFAGRVAFKGKVVARACVAPTAAEANALQDGEVLVTIMTTPDYVPAMRRAGAIVTDEGGLLSHAAIMSREFGKPCVIATKVATQLIKTGDMVEVDANTGVVRILNRTIR